MRADMLGLLVACVLLSIGTGLVYETTVAEMVGVAVFLIAVMLLLWFCLTSVSGLYRRDELRPDLTTADDVVPVFVVVSVSVWCIFLAETVVGAEIPAMFLVSLWIAALCSVLLARTAARALTRSGSDYVQNTLIVGAGDVGQLLGRKLAHHPELRMRLVGFIDEDPKSMRKDLAQVPVLGTPAEIARLVDEHDVQRILVAFSNEPHDRQLELVRDLRELDVQIDLVPRLFEAMGPAIGVHYVEGFPLVALPPARSMPVARAAKRIIDVVGAAISLLLLSPLFLFVAWRVKRSSPGPVFFRQERLGKNMRPFELLKFRTMRMETDDLPHREYVRSIMDTTQAPLENNLYKLNRTEDVTGTGSWLRRSSLDELPQLINVLRGEMSLVGPRPCLAYECDLFEPHHFDRFRVPAGITGLWQVTARSRSTFKEALDLDAAYARNWSLGMDLKLMMKTPFVLFRGRGTT